MPLSAYVQSAVFLVLAALALFGSAGSLAIPTFWLYLGILVAMVAASLLVLDPDLIPERMRPGGGRLPLSLRLAGLLPIAHWIIAGLDRGRLHWGDTVPASLQVIGFGAVAAGLALCFWALSVNPFFSSVARIQTDRGQHVIDAGPYAMVRHPGYSGALLFLFGSGFALDSWLATAALIVLSTPMLLRRAVHEDRMLQAELAGYRNYASRVRWRLVPGIW